MEPRLNGDNQTVIWTIPENKRWRIITRCIIIIFGSTSTKLQAWKLS